VKVWGKEKGGDKDPLAEGWGWKKPRKDGRKGGSHDGGGDSKKRMKEPTHSEEKQGGGKKHGQIIRKVSPEGRAKGGSELREG